MPGLCGGSDLWLCSRTILVASFGFRPCWAWPLEPEATQGRASLISSLEKNQASEGPVSLMRAGFSCLVCPAWALTRRCNSSPDEATRREGNHNCARATERAKQVGDEPASRR